MRVVTERTALRECDTNIDAVLKGEQTKIGHHDWRASIADVLATVDKQLKEHGLEVVQTKALDDNYVWYIDKRKRQTRK
jgi:hypothetical protein